MPFGQAGVEPTLIVSKALSSSWDWVLVRSGGKEWARLGEGHGLDSPPHSLKDIFFQEGLGVVGQKGDRVRIGTFWWDSLALPHFLHLLYA